MSIFCSQCPIDSLWLILYYRVFLSKIIQTGLPEWISEKSTLLWGKGTTPGSEHTAFRWAIASKNIIVLKRTTLKGPHKLEREEKNSHNSVENKELLETEGRLGSNILLRLWICSERSYTLLTNVNIRSELQLTVKIWNKSLWL